MRILVLGGGGREHAILDALARSSKAPELLCSPGNGGTAALARSVRLPDDPQGVAKWAAEHKVDLVVVGPEGPLVAGVADALEAAGVLCFGPKAAGARIEGSKTFAKELMARHGIPTAASRTFIDRDEALAYLEMVGAPVVVKADGLAAGKGVTVAMTLEQARDAVAECFQGRFGAAGEAVLIEEFLEGRECSLLAFTDGKTVIPMVPAQDHKRVFDDDLGPNTGGMGVYSPVPDVERDTYAQMVDILERTVAAMREEGIDYRGVLYGGFILTAEGPKVLEYNARFGDPETQVVLPRLCEDFVDICFATAEGRLAEVPVDWDDYSMLCVVLASGGYPGEYETGLPIRGIEDVKRVKNVTLYHAGTAVREDGRLVTAGGRVLDVVARGDNLAQARSRAYDAVDRIAFDDMHYRTDIGLRAIVDQREED